LLNEGSHGHGIRRMHELGILSGSDQKIVRVNAHLARLRRIASDFENQIALTDVSREDVFHLIGGKDRGGVCHLATLLGRGIVARSGTRVKRR
jgi:hypothetical protein